MKRIKKMGLYLLSFLLLLVVVTILFINIVPAFGGNPTTEQKEFYQHSNNYVDGKFINEAPAELVIT
jgi:competence protein ComGC